MALINLCVCVRSGRGQRYDNGSEGAEYGAERYREYVVYRLKPEEDEGHQPHSPVDTGPVGPGHRANEKPHPVGLRRTHAPCTSSGHQDMIVFGERKLYTQLFPYFIMHSCLQKKN